MGARYFWFWTSDHGHHVPWPEQLALARSLQQYARVHPRRSLYAPQPKVDTLITIPDGYFAALTDISWIHLSDQELQKYHRVLERTVKAAEICFERGRDFDLAIDDGHPIRGYKRVIRVTDQE